MNETLIIPYVVIGLIGLILGSLLESLIKRRSTMVNKNPPARDSLPVEGELLRAGRDEAGKPWLEVDGKRVDRDALPAEQRQALRNLMEDLRLTPPATFIPSIPERLPPKPAPIAEAPKKDKPTPAKAPAPVEMKSMVEQINQVLQKKLQTSPFSSRDIQLKEDPNGMLLIWDGTQRYEGIEAVPEPEIRSLIRQAAKDWEKGST